MTNKKITLLRAGPLKSSIEEQWPLYLLLCDAWVGLYTTDHDKHYYLYSVLCFIKKIVEEQGDGIQFMCLLSEVLLLIDIYHNETKCPI